MPDIDASPVGKFTAQMQGVGEEIVVPSAEETLRALVEQIATRRKDAAFQSRLATSVRRNQEVLTRLRGA